VYVSTSNGMKTDPTFSNAFIFGNLSSSSQEERSRLSGTAYGHIKVTIYIGFSIGSYIYTACLSSTF